MTADALVPIAVITGAHGLNGDVRVKLLNPDSALFRPGAKVIRRGRGGEPDQRMDVRSAHVHQPGLLRVAFAGCTDRNAAEALRGAELCVPRAELPKLEAGEYYLIDLIGLAVRNTAGEVIGRVLDAFEYPAAQALRVGVEGGSIEVPLFAPYVSEIRLDEGAVIVDHLEDLDLTPDARDRPR